MEMNRKKGWSKIWSIPALKALDEAVEDVVKRDAHVSKSEFVRDVAE